MKSAARIRGERNQAWLRLVLATALTGLHALATSLDARPYPGLLAAVLYAVAAVGLLGWTLVSSRERPWRRRIAVLVDGLAVAGVLGGLAEGPSLVALAYACLLLDTARRYGTRALPLAAAVCLAGLTATWLRDGVPGELSLAIPLGLTLLAGVALALQQLLRGVEEREARAEHERRDLLGLLGGEVQTPLQGVAGLVELLGRTPLTNAQQDLVRTLQHATRSVQGTLEAAVDAARLRARELEPESREFTPEVPVLEAFGLLAPEAQHLGRSLHLYMDPRLPRTLRGDAERWRRLLVLLLEQALRRVRGPALVLVVTLDEDQTERVRVGCRVYQRSAARSEVGPLEPGREGTACARLLEELASRLGGRTLWAGAPGQGGEVGVELPFARGAVTVSGALSGLRCVLVDDEEDSAARLTRRLTAWGVSAEWRTTPASLAGGHVDADLILVGAGEPAEAARALQLAAPDVPLVRLSATAPLTHEACARLAGAGYRAVLESPPETEQLANVLRWARAWRQPRSAPPQPAWAPSPTGLQVLLAQSDPELSETNRRCLSAQGHRVQLVATGDRALQALDGQHFDLAFLEADLPVVCGLQVARLFRMMRPDRRTLPVVVLAERPRADLEEQCQQLGNVRCLALTPDPRGLLAYMERFVAAGTASPDAATRPPRFKLVSSTRPALLDDATLDDLMSLNGDPAFLRELVEGFIEDGRQSLAAMQRALERQDPGELAEQAYALKGSARSIGASALAHVCSRLARTDAALADSAAELRAAEELLEETSKALTAYLDRQATARP